MLRLLLNPLVRVGLVLSLGILFVLLCFQYRWFGLLDLKIYDLGLTVRPRPESQSNVVIVAIDRYSRASSFEPPQFPISNHMNEHSRVIERLTEAAVPKTDEQYEEERLLAYLKTNLAQKPETINEQLVKTLQDFTGKEEFDDDFTVLTLKIL